MLIDRKYKYVKYCSLKSEASEYILNDIVLLIYYTHIFSIRILCIFKTEDD